MTFFIDELYKVKRAGHETQDISFEEYKNHFLTFSTLYFENLRPKSKMYHVSVNCSLTEYIMRLGKGIEHYSFQK